MEGYKNNSQVIFQVSQFTWYSELAHAAAFKTEQLDHSTRNLVPEVISKLVTTLKRERLIINQFASPSPCCRAGCMPQGLILNNHIVTAIRFP